MYCQSFEICIVYSPIGKQAAIASVPDSNNVPLRYTSFQSFKFLLGTACLIIQIKIPVCECGYIDETLHHFLFIFLSTKHKDELIIMLSRKWEFLCLKNCTMYPNQSNCGRHQSIRFVKLVVFISETYDNICLVDCHFTYILFCFYCNFFSRSLLFSFTLFLPAN